MFRRLQNPLTLKSDIKNLSLGKSPWTYTPGFPHNSRVRDKQREVSTSSYEI
jgi:hypothetical protein